MNKAKKSTVQVILLWWFIYFVFFALIASGISVIKRLNPILVLIVLAIVSLVFSLGFYYIGLIFWNKDMTERRNILKEIRESGPTPELVERYACEVEKVKNKHTRNYEYVNVADLYLGVQQEQKAAEALAKIDTQDIFGYTSAISVRMEIVSYYAVCLSCYLRLKDYEKFYETYAKAEKYFDEFEKEYPYRNIVAVSRANYYCLKKEYEKAIAALSLVQIKDAEEKRVMELNVKCAYIQIYSQMGEKDKAQMFFEDALPLIRNEYENRELELIMYGGM